MIIAWVRGHLLPTESPGTVLDADDVARMIGCCWKQDVQDQKYQFVENNFHTCNICSCWTDRTAQFGVQCGHENVINVTNVVISITKATALHSRILHVQDVGDIPHIHHIPDVPGHPKSLSNCHFDMQMPPLCQICQGLGNSMFHSPWAGCRTSATICSSWRCFAHRALTLTGIRDARAQFAICIYCGICGCTHRIDNGHFHTLLIPVIIQIFRVF